MLLAHIFFSIPFVVLNVLPKLKELDKNIFDAALDLGCTRFQAIFKVIIPSIKSGIIAGALIAFTMSIDDFVISYFVSGADFPNVSLWIYSRIGRRNFSPAVYSYNTLIIVVAITVIIVLNKIGLKKGEKNEKIINGN
jgi:spermidine/putrescine transport system permease protein